ncbi:MAG: stage IV sporulation protein A [Acutalibacteraceae bacterium]|nr:stage IV sporulation protein A [Acutalibacteraceae bacterium]
MTDIYNDISIRTNGDIYIGVAGPVRTGKSTFIKNFMDQLVIPNIIDESAKIRAKDELPQSAAGRTIMTTEPKFVPENGVNIKIDGKSEMKLRMIDCVGYIVPSAIGYIENEAPRMVSTPWFDEPIPFNMAAEIGTQKVINEHSTIGLVITTDGSIGDIPREEYAEAEQRVIKELQQINKPFVVLLNCADKNAESSVNLSVNMQKEYNCTVIPVNCLEMTNEDIKNIIFELLKVFPVNEIKLTVPDWISSLPNDYWLREDIIKCFLENVSNISKVCEVSALADSLCNNESVSACKVAKIDYSTGNSELELDIEKPLYYKALTDLTGVEIKDDMNLMHRIIEMAKTEKEYKRVKDALNEVEATGYGIVMPQIDELTLEEPEIVKQGGKYGVKLRASAPSIHMLRADINTEVSPIVGSEKQSEELIKYLLNEFEEDPLKIWDSNIFGKSLHELVNEGLHTKLAKMPPEARSRLQETIERVINEGCSGLICIIL